MCGNIEVISVWPSTVPNSVGCNSSELSLEVSGFDPRLETKFQRFLVFFCDNAPPPLESASLAVLLAVNLSMLFNPSSL
jgi:hypothetical protein